MRMRGWVLKSVGFSLVLWVVFHLSSSRAAEPGLQPVTRLEYADLYKQVLASYAGKEEQTRLAQSMRLALVALQLWINTKDMQYQEQALRYLDISLEVPKFDPKNSFKSHPVLHAFGELVFFMKKEGLILPQLKEKLNKIAIDELEVFLKSKDNADNNISLAKLAGWAGLHHYLDGETFPKRAEVEKRLSERWSLLVSTGDLDENASLYDSLGMVYLINAAGLLGKEDDLKKSPGFRRMFERFRDIVSPAGIVPEYGNSYFGYGVVMERVYLLEYAATLYNEPSFLYAARKLYGRPSLLPRIDHFVCAIPLINFKTLDAKPSVPEGSASQVTYRMRRGAEDPLVDKLILRTGLEPGAAMIMMDLYAKGSHAHKEKGPSLAYYEVDGVPLFHNLGRHGVSSAISGNLVWAQAPGQEFPGIWAENKWFTFTIPADLLNRDEQGNYWIDKLISFRNFQELNRSVKFMYLDNLRLEGSKGTLLLDDFDSDKGWDLATNIDFWNLKKVPGIEIEQSPDCTQGEYSQKINWGVVPSGLIIRMYSNNRSFSFSRQDYHSLKLDVKYEGARRPYMWIRNIGEDFELGSQLLRPEIITASSEQRGRDAFGTVQYKHYIEDGAELTRNIALTDEGFLVVCDTLAPAKTMEGWNVGQLWQLYQLKESGSNWYASEDDGEYMVNGKPVRRRMLVKYATEKTICRKIEGAYHNPAPNGRKPTAYFTTGSLIELKDEKPLTMVMVVAPMTPEQDAETAADGISITWKDAANVAVEIRTQGKKRVSLELGVDGKWKIER